MTFEAILIVGACAALGFGIVWNIISKRPAAPNIQAAPSDLKSYYEILGVSPNSETEVIAAAYKAMMRKYHPDTNGSASASDRSKEINEAYEVLKCQIHRKEYDEKRAK
jgi:preprotein translocase subunit Sec63